MRKEKREPDICMEIFGSSQSWQVDEKLKLFFSHWLLVACSCLLVTVPAHRLLVTHYS